MIRRAWTLILVLISVLSLCTGCGTFAGAQNARGTGARRVYDAPADKVWNAIPIALTQLGLSIPSISRRDACVLAERSASGWTWGEKVAVFLVEVSSSRTEVEVVSKRALATNVTAQNWESPILDRIEDILRAAEK